MFEREFEPIPGYINPQILLNQSCFGYESTTIQYQIWKQKGGPVRYRRCATLDEAFVPFSPAIEI